MNVSIEEFGTDESQTENANQVNASSKKAYLISRDGIIGYIKQGEAFQPRSNFDVEVVGNLKNEGIIVGYLFNVKRVDDTNERKAFLSNTDCSSSGTILKVLNKCFHNRGLWIPTKDHRLDIDLPIYLQTLICKYMERDVTEIQEYYPVTLIGRQPQSDVWVLGKNLQINKYGQVIPDEEQQYVFEETLLTRVDVPVHISTCEEGTQSLEALITSMNDLLAENYISSLLVVGGVVLSVHAELIMKHRKACPMVMAVGPTKCGKTTALNCAASIIGSRIWGTGTSFSVAAVMEQSHGSTMGYCLDDVKDDRILEEIVINTYNQGGYVNLATGRKIPKCTPVFTSNWTPSESRILSRLAVVPFAVPKTPLRGMERMKKEDNLMKAMECAAKGIGTVIKIGAIYETETTKNKVYSELTEFVMSAIGNDFTRESINYAEVLGFTEMFCTEIGGPTLEELKDHFLQTIAPYFRTLVGAECKVPQPIVLTAHGLQQKLVRLCKEEPNKVVTSLNPMVICSETKEKCIAISLSEFIKAASLQATESMAKEKLGQISCIGVGCKIKHQANFLSKKSKVPTKGKIIFKTKGDEKNTTLRCAVFIKRTTFERKELEKIAQAFDTGNWNQCPANDDGAAVNQRENPKADHAKQIEPQTEQLVVEAEKADEVKDKENETEKIPVSANSEEPPNKRAKECSSINEVTD